MNKKIFGIFIFVATIMACRHHDDFNSVREEGLIPVENVLSNIAGRVLSNLGEPLEGATVEIGGTRVWTDKEGYFLFPKGQYDSNGTLLRVEKQGYFSAHRFAYPQSDGVENVLIYMMSASKSGEFMASKGGTIMIYNASVTVPAGAVGKNGVPYDGAVTAYVTWLDPTKETTFETMPGDLRGIEDGKVKFLRTFGMLGVELREENGGLLQLLPGRSATISATVPNPLLSDAPPTIPLWHFDDGDGCWKKEGEAVLKNGNYEGTVGHFSFWNYDISVPLAFLEGKVVGTGARSLLGTTIHVKTLDFGTSWTAPNDEGGYKGLVPVGVPFTVEVQSWCGKILYSENYPALKGDTQLLDINVGTNNDVMVSGTLRRCDGTPLENGLCAIVLNNISDRITVKGEQDGAFVVTLPDCFFGGHIQLRGFDPVSLEESRVFFVPFLDAGQNVGGVALCADADAYVNLTVGEKTDNYFTDLHVFYDGFFEIYVLDAAKNKVLSIVFDHYEAANQTAKVKAIKFDANHWCNACVLNGIDNVLIVSAPTQQGMYAQGKVTGRITDFAGSPQTPFKMEFKVKRE